MSFTHETYLGPFSWRYGSEAMRRIWSEAHKRRLWRRIWVALADAQQRAGLVRAEQVDDLRAHMEDVDIDRSHALEETLRHDLMAEVHCFAEQCSVGGGIIHLGATSMDIEDNADVLRMREALTLLGESLRALAGHPGAARRGRSRSRVHRLDASAAGRAYHRRLSPGRLCAGLAG